MSWKEYRDESAALYGAYLSEPDGDLSARIRAVALDIKEIAQDANTKEALLRISSELYEEADRIEGIVSCDVCGDCHDKDSVPLSCQTGDGE